MRQFGSDGSSSTVPFRFHTFLVYLQPSSTAYAYCEGMDFIAKKMARAMVHEGDFVIGSIGSIGGSFPHIRACILTILFKISFGCLSTPPPPPN